MSHFKNIKVRIINPNTNDISILSVKKPQPRLKSLYEEGRPAISGINKGFKG